jgi:translation initiation factor IF-1
MRPAAERDLLEFTGVVREQRRSMFVVDVTAGALRREVLCTLSGRLNMNRIRLCIGDEVQVEVTPYDLRRGRIVYRGKREARS